MMLLRLSCEIKEIEPMPFGTIYALIPFDLIRFAGARVLGYAN